MIITEMLENYLKTCTFESGLVLPCLFDGPDAIVSIYFTLSRSLFRLFNDRHADYMDFNLIRDELKVSFFSFLSFLSFLSCLLSFFSFLSNLLLGTI